MAATRCLARSIARRLRSSIHGAGIPLQDRSSPLALAAASRFMDDRSLPRWSFLVRRHQHCPAAAGQGENLAVAAPSPAAVESSSQEKVADPFVADFGFSKIFAKKHFPELLKPGFQAKIRPVFSRLRSFGVDNAALKSLAKDHSSRLREHKFDLDKSLEFLTRYGLDQHKIADTVKKHPAILIHSVAAVLEPAAKLLREQALSPHAISATLAASPAVFTTSKNDLLTRIAVLGRVGISPKYFNSCVMKHPSLLGHDADQRLRPMIKVLVDRLPLPVVRTLVPTIPTVFARKPELVDDLISAFKYIGFQGAMDTWTKSMAWGIRFGPEAVRDKIDFLMGMDIHYRQVAVMLKDEPYIFQIDNAVIKEKVDFLFKVMKLDIDELLKCPSYLTRKAMDRVKVRWKVLSLLRSRGIIQKVHLKDLVTLPSKYFVETFVFKYPDCGRVYYGERSALKQARAEARGKPAAPFY